MIATKGYAAQSAESSLAPFQFDRREVGPHDVQLEIFYCGVCHSDLHQARNEWGGSIFPMVPGHEIVGKVVKVGAQVQKFRIGDLAGVGCIVDSCRTCSNCKSDYEQYCEVHSVGTYNSLEMDRKTPTYGGYSNHIVVDENFTLHISEKLNLAGAAPLLCAGITTWSPLRHWRVSKGMHIAVVGLGGLGHMGVKLAASLGAEVTVLSTSPGKEADAKKLGAHNFALSSEAGVMKKLRNTFDFILDTVSAPHNMNEYLQLVKLHGTMALVGIPPKAMEVHPFSVISNRRSLAGSSIGGIRETQEMLDYCATHQITSDIELIDIRNINKAYERLLKGDVKYRFVIDMKTL